MAKDAVLHIYLGREVVYVVLHCGGTVMSVLVMFARSLARLRNVVRLEKRGANKLVTLHRSATEQFIRRVYVYEYSIQYA